MAKKENQKNHYFKELKGELKKVNWLTPKQLVNNTIAVITIVIITAIIVFALDIVFDIFNKYVIVEPQAKVQSMNSENEINNYTNTVTEGNEIDTYTNSVENNVE